MSLLDCRNLTIEVAGSPLLNGISLRIEQGEKIGLIGPNGAGKTTLIRAIIGEFPLEKGRIDRPITIGYLPQTPDQEQLEGTVFDAMLMERKDILDMRNQLRFLEIRMAEETDERVFDRYSSLTEQYERAGGYALEAAVRKILSGLGLEEALSKEIANLSGGQKTRLAIGKLLIREPELLILDEPTNHLDMEAIEWLEDYLKDYVGSVLLVSHDRYFLDKVVEGILYIYHGDLRHYKGNFSQFGLQKAVEEKSLLREAERVNKKIASLEAYIRRFGAGIKAKQARGRESQLKKITPVQVVPTSTKSIRLDLKAGIRTGDLVLELNQVGITYQNKIIVNGIDLTMRRGDKLALLGKNGVGKTSLLKAIKGEVPFLGHIRLGSNVKISYYSQEHGDINLQNTIIEEMRYSSTLDDPQIRDLLARFGFRNEDVFKGIASLSGGEKSRLALCKLFLSGGNFLLLDEPTNHLDMDTKEILEETLQDYDGTFLTISHDRYFLSKVVNTIAILSPTELEVLDGGYSDYLDYLEREKEQQRKEESSAKKESAAKDFQEESKLLKRREKRRKQLEKEIQQKENQLEELASHLEALTSDYEQILNIHTQQERVNQDLEHLLEEWVELGEVQEDTE